MFYKINIRTYLNNFHLRKKMLIKCKCYQLSKISFNIFTKRSNYRFKNIFIIPSDRFFSILNELKN